MLLQRLRKSRIGVIWTRLLCNKALSHHHIDSSHLFLFSPGSCGFRKLWAPRVGKNYNVCHCTSKQQSDHFLTAFSKPRTNIC